MQIPDSNDLPGSLEEFGLSKYEARAYLTMVGKGSLAASEIAYYANLPRTKVYQTIKKLEKKRLAVISKQKPMICSAIPPEEAFSEIVSLHDRRLKNMKKIVDRLQKINDEGQRPKGSEERRYFVLGPDSALEKVGHLIANSKSTVTATLDAWGIRLVSQCKPSIVRAITSGVRINVIVGAECIGSENLFSLPEGIELRVGQVLSNLIIVDSSNVISVDSSNGKAALFASLDTFSLAYSKNFEEMWTKAAEYKYLLDAEPATAAKAVQLTRIIENGLSANMLEYAVTNHDGFSVELLDMIEQKYGIKMSSMNSGEMIDLVNSALKISYSGGLKHDKNNNTLSLQSKVDSKHILPWALVLASYFKQAGNEPKIIQQSYKQGSSQVVLLRLAKPI